MSEELVYQILSSYAKLSKARRFRVFKFIHGGHEVRQLEDTARTQRGAQLAMLTFFSNRIA